MHNSIYIEGISFSDLRKQLFQELKKRPEFMRDKKSKLLLQVTLKKKKQKQAG